VFLDFPVVEDTGRVMMCDSECISSDIMLQLLGFSPRDFARIRGEFAQLSSINNDQKEAKTLFNNCQRMVSDA
jgi:hypothetical protein